MIFLNFILCLLIISIVFQSYGFTLEILLIICLFILSYGLIILFKWRRHSENNKVILIPEETIEILDQYKDKNNETISKISDNLNNFQQNIDKRSKSLEDQLNELIKFTEAQQKEIERYKEGHDFVVLKSLVLGIIDSMDLLDKGIMEANKDKSSPAYLDATKNKLDIILQRFGIEKFHPSVGNHISKEVGANPISSIPSKQENIIGTIKEVLKPGMRMNIGNNIKIIKEAEVSVYSKE